MSPFKPVAVHDFPSIQANATAWIHPCGLRHIHIHAPDPHLSMLVHVPTSSDSDDGVAHALEHMVMEGSVNYQVDNIISRLSERTMSTFMNAMTSPSATMYPFSCANPADFTQIAKVYLDCVFNPRLPAEAFPLEVARVVMKDGKKAFDGVVFNEMRGAFSDPGRIQQQQQSRWLAPDTPLTRNSGGDPVHIVDLTMDRLRQFHAQHYHPSRCTVVSYGDVDPAAIQDLIVQGISPALDRPVPTLASPPAPSVAPVGDAVIDMPHADGQSEHGVLLAWPLPATSSRFQQSLYRLYAALLSSPGGPLAHCLDDISPASISQCSHMEVANRHYLVIGAVSLREGQEPLARGKILAAMRELSLDPPHPQTIEAILNNTQMGILLRSATTSDMGQHLCRSIAQALDHVTEPADVLEFIDDQDLLARLQSYPIQEGFARFLAQIIQYEPHQALVRPDPQFYEKIANHLEEKLVARTAQPDPVARIANVSSLPTARISADAVILPPPAPVQWIDAAPGVSICHIQGGVEGVYTLDLVADLSGMDLHRVDMIQAAMDLANLMGTGDVGWKEQAAQRRRDGFSPSGRTDIETRADGCVSILQVLSQSSLGSELDRICPHILQTISECRYDPQRASIILASIREDLKYDAAGRAENAARIHAHAGLTGIGSVNGALRGLNGDMSGLRLAKMNQTSPDELIQELDAARAEYMASPMAIKVIGRDIPQPVMDLARQLSKLRPGGQAYRPGAFVPQPVMEQPSDTAFVAPMHVNRCIQAWRAPQMFDSDAPAASLLAQVVTDQHLYDALREKGGAYGGSFSWSAGAFEASSFRDPRLEGTFRDFAGALDWIASGAITPDGLHQAKVNQLARVTRPVSRFNQAQAAWARQVAGVDDGVKARFIQGLLDASLDDVQAVAAKWLHGRAQSTRAACIGPQSMQEACKIGMDIVDMPSLFSDRPAKAPSP